MHTINKIFNKLDLSMVKSRTWMRFLSETFTSTFSAVVLKALFYRKQVESLYLCGLYFFHLVNSKSYYLYGLQQTIQSKYFIQMKYRTIKYFLVWEPDSLRTLVCMCVCSVWCVSVCPRFQNSQ